MDCLRGCCRVLLSLCSAIFCLFASCVQWNPVNWKNNMFFYWNCRVLYVNPSSYSGGDYWQRRKIYRKLWRLFEVEERKTMNWKRLFWSRICILLRVKPLQQKICGFVPTCMRVGVCVDCGNPRQSIWHHRILLSLFDILRLLASCLRSKLRFCSRRCPISLWSQ